VRARQILDGAGLERARIVVSGGLDEYDIDALVATDAPVDVYAVGRGSALRRTRRTSIPPTSWWSTPVGRS
jgi:nicotinic acid phosphoribosyltransferase